MFNALGKMFDSYVKHRAFDLLSCYLDRNPQLPKEEYDACVRVLDILRSKMFLG